MLRQVIGSCARRKWNDSSAVDLRQSCREDTIQGKTTLGCNLLDPFAYFTPVNLFLYFVFYTRVQQCDQGGHS